MASTGNVSHNKPASVCIWLVLSDKLGDNAQAEIIARSLQHPYQVRHVRPLEKYVFGKPRFGISLRHIDRANSDILEPPWPDLIITVGRRSAMVALWIKQQSKGHTRVVLLGRPRRWLEKFDLVITPIQYRLPAQENILHINLPLMRPDETKINTAVETWAPRLIDMKQPIIAVFIGGPTRPFIFDTQVAKKLMHAAGNLAKELNGSLYLSTSRRTPTKVVNAIQDAMPETAKLYCWGDAPEDNPYQALLGLADYVMVTGDSVSMMVEAARLGKPLSIFPLPAHWIGRIWLRISEYLHPANHDSRLGGVFEPLGRLFYRLGLTGFPRDLTLIHRYLFKQRLATPPGDAFLCNGDKAQDELPAVVEKIEGLIDLKMSSGCGKNT